MFFLRISFRLLRNEKLFACLFALNLSLGVLGFLTLEAFKEALNKVVARQAQEILGADLAVNVRRPFTAEERGNIKAALPVSATITETLEFFAMVSSKEGARLSLLKVVGEPYPVRGQIGLFERGEIGEAAGVSLNQGPAVWLDRTLAEELSVGIGDKVRVGRSELEIVDLVNRDPTQSFRGFAMGGRAYIGLINLAATDLVQEGSTVTYALLIGLPEQTDSLAVKNSILEKIQDPAVRVTLPSDAAEQSSRAFEVLGDYLGLASLVALGIASLGAIFLFIAFLRRKIRDFAVLIALGLRPRQVGLILQFQLSLLALLSLALAAAVYLIIAPSIVEFAQIITPVRLEPEWPWRAFFVSSGVLLGTLFCISYPFIERVNAVEPAQLFRSLEFSAKFSTKSALQWLPSLLLLFLLAVWQANSWKVGGLFLGVVCASALLLIVSGRVIFRFISAVTLKKYWWLKEGVRSWDRKPAESLVGFLAIGIGSLLLTLIPQMERGLSRDLEISDRGKIPSVFLFDIQEEQLEPLNAVLGEKKLKLESLSPLVRGRIIAVNDKPYERSAEANFRTREEEVEARFRNRGVNISYYPVLKSSERIIAGRVFSASPVAEVNGQIKAEISVEQRFAQRMGFALGDKIRFDVQGVEILGEIVNLRAVKWTSFQPNFFIVMPPGVLEAAPKTFLANLFIASENEKRSLRVALSREYSNISQVDVADVISRILDLLNKTQMAMQLMALLSLLSGFMVLFSILQERIASRAWLLQLYQTLGASPRELQGLLLVEFVGLTLIASLLGLLLSVALAFGLFHFIFDIVYLPQPGLWLFLPGFVAAMAWVLVVIFTYRSVKHANPSLLLRSE